VAVAAMAMKHFSGTAAKGHMAVYGCMAVTCRHFTAFWAAEWSSEPSGELLCSALSVLLSMATNKQPPKVNAVKVLSVKAFRGPKHLHKQ